MMEPGAQRQSRQIEVTLADLFDGIPLNDRREAEEELRGAGIDPAAVALRTEQLVARLGITIDPAASAAAAPRRRRRHTLGWSIAATLVLSSAALLLLNDADARRMPDWFRRPRAVTPRLPSTAEVRPSGAAAIADAAAEHGEAPPALHADGAPVIDADPSDGAAGTAASAARSYARPAANAPMGEIVTAANIDQHLAALSPGLEWAVRHGLRLRIVAARSIFPPAAYREATERYGQARLAPDGLSLQNYVAGLPFPRIDPNDPHVAIKIMWNHAHGFFATDDLEASEIVVDTGVIGADGQRMTIERQFSIERLRRLYFTGRLFVDERPERHNPEAIRYREAATLGGPADLEGVGLTSIRYLSPTRGDDTWLYLPGERRVRRVAAKERADAWFRQDADVDSFFGFSGHIGSAEFRFLGEGHVLASMHAEHDPVRWGSGSADFAFDDVWEARPVYVIEAASTLPAHAYGKRILFIDKEAWVIPFADIYDRQGELWKVWINMFSTRAITSPAAPWMEGDELLTLPASVVVDVQAAHATRISVPERDGAPGWRFNQGQRAFGEDWFGIGALIDRGH